MYDDIAMSILNPRKGVLINHPSGEDVYAGVPKVHSNVNVLYFGQSNYFCNCYHNFSMVSAQTIGFYNHMILLCKKTEVA